MIPNLFWKTKMPDKLPDGMQAVADELKKCASKEECLGKAFEIVDKKYKSMHLETYIYFFNLFITDLEKLWNLDKGIQCTAINYVLRALLVKSGWFEDSDIKFGYSLVYYISPHQYLKIKVDNDKIINVDVWNADFMDFEQKIGKYASGFGFK